MNPVSRAAFLHFLRAKSLRGALLIFLLAGLVGALRPSPPLGAPGARLLLTSAELAPESTFELRFEEPVARPEDVGVAASPVPLDIVPRLPGVFVWKSRRSGVFSPSEPMRLGVTYRFALPRGLRDSAGRALRPGLLREFRTPGLSAELERQDWWAISNAPVLPRFSLKLNASVRPQDAAEAMSFLAKGRRIAARVIPIEPAQAGTDPGEDETEGRTDRLVGGLRFVAASSPTWEQRFRSARPEVGEARLADTNVAHVFLVEPVEPLVAGLSWRLEVSRRLHGVDAGVRLSGSVVADIGVVAGFEVVSVEPVASVKHGREIRLRFSLPVDEGVTNAAAKWVVVEPAPAGLELRHEPLGATVILAGAFELGRRYEVRVAEGLRARQPVALRRGCRRVIEFEPLVPNVWLKTYEAPQLAIGRRKLELLAVNVPETRLRAKRLGEDTLIHTLRAYQRSLNSNRRRDEADQDEAPPGPLDFAAVAGRTVLDTNLPTLGDVDAARRLELGWDDLLGSPAAGAFYVHTDLHGIAHPTNCPPRRNGPQAIIQLTDLGFVVKSAGSEAFLWVFSHHTGRSLANVKVSLRTDENHVESEGLTGNDGLVRLTRTTNSSWALLALGEDLHAAQLGAGTVWPWMFHVPTATEPPPTNLLWGFTDRQAYRPGELLHLKVFGRSWRDEAWAAPASGSVAIKLVGPRDDDVLRTNLSLSAAGSADWTYRLPATDRGSWAISMAWADATERLGFELRDLRPAAFSINTPARAEYDAGEPVVIPLTARYLFGQALSRGSVRWSMEDRDAEFAPEGWDSFRFCQAEDDWRLRGGGRARDALEQHEVVPLTADGNVWIRPTLPLNAKRPQPRHAELLAEVTDINQQTLSHRVEFTRHSSSFYLGFRWKEGEETIFAAKARPEFEVVAVRPGGAPLEQPVDVLVTVQRVDWKVVRLLGAGGSVDYRSEPELNQVASLRRPTQAAAKRGIRWEAVGGHERGLPGLDEPGEYLVALDATDEAGRPVRTTATLYVEGDGKVAWNYHNGAQIELAADRSSYQPGETAMILVKAPFAGTALVSVERETVRRSFLAPLEGNTPVVRVPVTAADSPNVFVSVTLIRGGKDNPHEYPMPEWRVGEINLPVVNPAEKLSVAVTASAAVYQPGETVDTTARVLDSEGRPVAGAEVVLFAVDEGYLRLTGAEAPDPYAGFRAERPLGVSTALSLGALFPENPELQDFVNKGFVAGGGGRLGLSRSNFEPCPLWAPSLLTDAAGEVRAQFRAPDSLTAYRISAVAVRGSAGGGGAVGFEVRKPLMIESATPRFAHVRDQLGARAVIHNQSGADLAVRASLEPAGALAAGGGAGLATNLAVPRGATVAVEFPVQLLHEGSNSWTWRAESIGAGTAWRDSVSAPMVVSRAEPRLREVRLAMLGLGATNLLTNIDPALLEGEASVNVKIASSPLVAVTEGAARLIEYPYGCVEQTASSLLPWIALRDLPQLLPAGRRGPSEISATIAAGVERLLSMQTREGGLAYWPGGREPQRWGSAYGALVLALARNAGAEVPRSQFEKLQAWLSAHWSADEDADDPENTHERCLVACALAYGGEPDFSLHDTLLARRDLLSPEDASILALALAVSADGGPEIEGLLTGATRSKVRFGLFGSESRTAAVRLLAASAAGGPAARASRLAAELITRQRAGQWVTTQGNAWSLWALADFAKRTGAGRRVKGTVRIGGRSLGFEGAAEPLVFDRTFQMEPADANGGVVVQSDDPGGLYGLVEVTGRWAPAVENSAPVDHGFSIRRNYAKLDEDNRPQPAAELHLGDRVLVTLEVDASEEAAWVAIEEPIPAILEVIEGAFVTDQTRAAKLLDPWVSDFREVRQDRLLIFRDVLPEGRHSIRYLARVRASGSVVAAPARIEAMYEPDRHGLSAGGRLHASSAE